MSKVKKVLGFFTGILWVLVHYFAIHIFTWIGGTVHRTPDAYYFAYGEKVCGLLPSANTFNFNVCGYITVLSLWALIKIRHLEVVDYVKKNLL